MSERESRFDARRDERLGEWIATTENGGLKRDVLDLLAEIDRLGEARRMDASALTLCVAAMRAFMKGGDTAQIEAMLLCVDENDWLGRSQKVLEPSS